MQMKTKTLMAAAVAAMAFGAFAKDIYLLVGQSNMAGRGHLSDDAPIPNERIEKLDKSDKWVAATEPLHFDKPSAGAGLGMSFARIVADRDRTVTVGLVPCAVGGSALDEWMPGAHLYVEAMRRAKIAQKDGEIKAILWHQGESDADRGKREASYNARLAKMVAAMREELGLDAKKVPFLFGSIGEFMHAPYYDGNCSLNKVMRHATDLIPNSAWVEGGDLTCNGDMIHFNTRSVRTFGQRYAAAYLRLVKKEPILLRNLYTDHMMFAAGKLIVLVGRTAPGAKVSVAAGALKASATAGGDGAFRAELPAQKAGTALEITLRTADDAVTLRDVLVGELVLAIGDEASAKDASRILTVPQEVAPQGPNENIPGCAGWRVVKAGGAPKGAVVVKSSVTDKLAWMSERELRKAGQKDALDDLAYVRTYRPVVDGKYQVPRTLQRKAETLKKWIAAVEQAGGATSADARKNWMKPELDEKGWEPAKIAIAKPSFVWYRWHIVAGAAGPSLDDEGEAETLDGVPEIRIPAGCADLRFACNGIVDTDEAWFDGEKIGETGVETKYHWGAWRNYAIRPPKEGRHVLAVRVLNHYGAGGMNAPRLEWKGGVEDLAKAPGLMRVETAPDAKTGPRPPSPWGSDFELSNPGASPTVPATLYNAILAPLEVLQSVKER